MAKKRKSVMTHQFSQVPKAEIPRSSFDRSHGLKTTLNAGLLIPILCDEALPGDTFNVDMTAFARLATPIFPIMDNMFMETFFFSVPMRLLWDNWAKFNGEQDNPGDSTDFLMPMMTSTTLTGYDNETIHDYIGIPTLVPDLEHSCMWHRAYNLCFQQWFRDQNLQDSPIINKGDGPDLPTDYALLRRGKRHDYFTSGLPWPSKPGASGISEVPLPIGQSAPIIGDGTPMHWGTAVDGTPTDLTTDISAFVGLSGVTSALQILGPDSESGLIADLTAATGSTINQLRQAFQIQRLLERDARGGTRLIEITKAHFGVTSPDLRATRPEYLGGGSSPVNITPIAQTNASSSDVQIQNSPQGNLAAIGTATLHNHGFTKSFTEHCIIIGMVAVRADLTYQQGLNRMFSRSTRFDHYWPSLSHIGEQAILTKEIFASGVPVEDDVIFAYQERYAEYRYKPSLITGKFRSNDPVTLDSWHLSQNFLTAPVLDDLFIQDNPPLDRVIAVPSEPHFIFDAHFSMRCARPMPLYGVPGMIDHF